MVMPKAKLGKRAVLLSLIFLLSLFVLFMSAKSGQKGGTYFFENPALALPALLASLSAVASFILGTLSLLKEKEFNSLLMASTLITFLAVLFIIGEISSSR